MYRLKRTHTHTYEFLITTNTNMNNNKNIEDDIYGQTNRFTECYMDITEQPIYTDRQPIYIQIDKSLYWVLHGDNWIAYIYRQADRFTECYMEITEQPMYTDRQIALLRGYMEIAEQPIYRDKQIALPSVTWR